PPPNLGINFPYKIFCLILLVLSLSAFADNKYEYYSDGKMKKMSIYEGDKLSAVNEYYENGKIKSKSTYDNEGDEKYEEYYENGKLKKEIEIVNFGKISLVTEYDENGKLKSECSRSGPWSDCKEYYENGKIKSKSTYDNVETYDEKSESVKYVVIEYDQNGKIKKTSVYDDFLNGKLETVLEYYENGKIKKSSVYGNDGKISEIYELDENQNLQKILQYSKGAFVRNLLETVQCVYNGLLTNAMLIRDATIFEKFFGSVESKIWRKDNSLPSDLKQKATQSGYKFIAIKTSEGTYYWFRYYNGEWFFAAIN
ncbi:MAG: hypothetical protein FWF51_12825, partial [Chitinivibrionia bacterium]|nr:hypothetical protein [Chitinivibrionia bacterium]